MVSVGDKFGRLTVVSRQFIPGTSKSAWQCLCDCGNNPVIRGHHLTQGRTKSCGCLKRENSTTHGHHKSKAYTAWQNIKKRCLNPNSPEWNNYGGRGITICDRWKDNFEAFLEDVGHPPDKTSTIDRIDNNKGYEPGNCRWTSRKVQQLNRRACRSLTYQGKTQTAIEWAQELNVSPNTIYTRLHRGWSEDRVFEGLKTKGE